MHQAIMSCDGELRAQLFTYAISATPYNPVLYDYSDRQPTQAYYSLALAAGCLSGRAYGSSSAKILDRSRATPSNTLQNACATDGASCG